MARTHVQANTSVEPREGCDNALSVMPPSALGRRYTRKDRVYIGLRARAYSNLSKMSCCSKYKRSRVSLQCAVVLGIISFHR